MNKKIFINIKFSFYRKQAFGKKEFNLTEYKGTKGVTYN